MTKRVANRVVPTAGDRVVVCHVPEHDFERGLYTEHTVSEVWADGQVILDDGWRTGVGSCWPTLRSIVVALNEAEALRDADERIMRGAW